MHLTICHRTVYRYARPVELLPHRLLLCPRGQHDMRLLTTLLSCTPPAHIEWTQDVFGNMIATANFASPVERLAIDSRMVVEQSATAWPIFSIAPSAHSYPFDYSPDEIADLGALRTAAPDDADGAVGAWARGFVGGGRTDTLDLLKAINHAIHSGIAYRWRDEEGTQRADETLATSSGSCRDLATLLIAAVRSLGFGARAVSGYLFDPSISGDGAGQQHGATHAWAEVYLPCAGWIAFDPTNDRVGNANLVPVAVGRALAQIMPITGGYVGDPGDFIDMAVDVTVTASEPSPAV
jgi:transglutaminase-like putative cysteine protease